MLKPPRIGRVIDLPLIGEPRPTLREVVQLAKTINRDAGTKVLAQMNLFLGVAAVREDLDRDPDARWKAQERMIAATVSQRRLRQLKDKLGNAHLRENIVFHRAQLMAAIRLVGLFGDPTRGNPLETRDDAVVLTELALAINSLMDYGPAPDSATHTVRHLAPLMAPARELDDLPRIDNALVRSWYMLGDLLKGRADRPGAQSLEQLFVFLTNGFSFETFQTVMFGLFAYFQSLSLENLPRFQRDSLLNPYAAGNIISSGMLDQFLKNLSIDASDLPTVVPPLDNEKALLLDTTFFRAFPVWRYSPESYLCVDLCFVVEKLASGFYWAVNQALDTNQRRYEFSSLWGQLFEDYVLTLLRYAVPPESGRLIENPFYEHPHHVEAFDAVVLEGTNAIVMQVKGTFARASGKYSGEFRPFFEALSEKFGNLRGAAIRQMGSNIRSTFGLPRRRELPDVPVRAVRVVWPVVVVLEPILGFGLASRLLVERFVKRCRRLVPQAYTSIRPPVFVQIEDLETLTQHVRDGDFTFVDCFREKLGHDPSHFFSFHDFYVGQFVPEHRITFKKNAWTEAKYGAVRERSLGRLEGGELTKYKSTPFGAICERSQL
jgi:hypothetical protein